MNTWLALDMCMLTMVAIVVGVGYGLWKAFGAMKSIAPEAASAVMPTLGRLAVRSVLSAVIGHHHHGRRH